MLNVHRTGAAGAVRRFRRPDRFQQQHAQGSSRGITPDDAAGDYIHYGVREFGMTAAMSGMALHGGLIPYGGTFLTFSDYARNARAHGGADASARDPGLQP